MYNPGDTVVYGVHGVCVVREVTTRTIDKKERTYFVLHPVSEKGDSFFVPTDNQVALSKIRSLLTRTQFEELFSSEISGDDYWIPDENQRKMRYREMISCGDRTVLVGILRALYAHKANQLAQGKKFHMCDENFLRDAQKLLCSELSYVLQISQADAVDYIQRCLDK